MTRKLKGWLYWGLPPIDYSPLHPIPLLRLSGEASPLSEEKWDTVVAIDCYPGNEKPAFLRKWQTIFQQLRTNKHASISHRKSNRIWQILLFLNPGGEIFFGNKEWLSYDNNNFPCTLAGYCPFPCFLWVQTTKNLFPGQIVVDRGSTSILKCKTPLEVQRDESLNKEKFKAYILEDKSENTYFSHKPKDKQGAIWVDLHDIWGKFPV